MRTQSLNGVWMRRIGEGDEQEQTVPYSARPVGRSTCSRSFTVDGAYKRLFLKFDGITYQASVRLNGHLLGEMRPYCEYEFEITDHVLPGENRLAVDLEDLDLPFGPTPGWENFSGIIRDVSLILRDENYISDVFFKSVLTNHYQEACISVDVKTDKSTDLPVSISLFDRDGVCVLSWQQKADAPESKHLSAISLWSPDDPALYTLRVSLADQAHEIDMYTCHVGFRELRCERHRFLLNGKPLFLNGVCKHEMVGDSGHVVSYEQVEADMKMIKSIGLNFVRLVHYPHCKMTLDIADRLGLMVSEEPGLWWADTANEEVAAGSLEVLRRTILRDRNHPSIVFWLTFNECEFAERYLLDSVKLCRQYDPTRLVSGANCMDDEDTLYWFNQCQFDFYTMHPYAPSFDRAQRSAEVLYDKPLLFTEWGGYDVFDNPAYLRTCIRRMAALYHANADSGALAGAFYWCWADINDFNRGAPFVDGVLLEGLVTKDRQKHMCYDIFREESAKIEAYTPDAPYRFRLCTPLPFRGEPFVLCTDSGDFSALMDHIVEEEQRALPFKALPRPRKIKNLPILHSKEAEDLGISPVPAMLTDENRLVYKGSRDTATITLIGAVSISKGYPISGALGEEAALVTVVYEGGEQIFSLRNGRELTTVFATIGSSRIDPRADKAPRLAEFSYDLNYEQYIINRLTLELDSVRSVKRVEISSLGNGYSVLIYGILAGSNGST